MGTMIALSTCHPSADAILADGDIRAFRAARIGPVEIRLDMLEDIGEEAVRRLVRALAPPPGCIATFRRREERGPGAPDTRASGLDEESRIRLLELAAVEGASHVDLELACASAARRIRRAAPTVKIILSFHDFRGMPDDLHGIFSRMQEAGADVAKVAVTARRTEDNWAIFRCLKEGAGGKIPRIGICMGPDGLPSRVLGGLFGACLTYASPSGAGGGNGVDDRPGKPSAADLGKAPVAPGQIPWRTMAGSYRAHHISSSWRVYGVIGNPIAHSLSPAMHNAAMASLGLDAVYVPFRVEGSREEVRRFLNLASEIPVSGLSVTTPHKEAALACAAEAEPLARRIGAANTLVPKADGSWAAYNTDCGAAIASLIAAISGAPTAVPGASAVSVPPVVSGQATASGLAAPETPGGRSVTAVEPVERGGPEAGGPEASRPDGGVNVAEVSLAGREVLLLGAGGAARALAVGLLDAGARLYICNRGFERARILAHETGAKAVRYDELDGLGYSIVVNATSVGMYPDVEETPLEARLLPRGGVVFDTIYIPAKTRLLREAEAAGCLILNGVDMFVRQGAAQFAIWTGRPAPADVMRRAVEEA
ncbi:MAG: type I 3-dehydroquinate dehydratase, partial [Planctomycetota bacterium]|nr:type I 3-dehydroquinate dehydratase [Planctomycetota bacterium]